MKRGHSTFQRKSDITVHVWTDKRLVQLVSMSHYRTIMNAGRKGKRTALEIKASYTVFQYNEFMMGVDMADNYFRYYSVLRNTVKWPNLYAKLHIPQCNFVYKTLNTSKKISIRTFCARLQGSRYQKFRIHELYSPEKQPTPSCPKQVPPPPPPAS